MLNTGMRPSSKNATFDLPMTTLVGQLLNSQYSIEKRMHTYLTVTATAQTETTGWYGGQLIPWIYMKEPSDGILDIDFYGKLPWYTSTLGEGTLRASLQMEMLDWMKGYRIHVNHENVHEVLFEADSLTEGYTAPRYAPYFLEIGRGLSGVMGSSYNSVIFTDKAVFFTTKDIQESEGMEYVRSLTEEERQELFAPSVVSAIKTNERHPRVRGFYNYISYKEGDHFYYIMWDSFGDVPPELAALFRRIMTDYRSIP